jgi:hypothetical protein
MKLGARGKDISDRELKCVFTPRLFVVKGVRPKSGVLGGSLGHVTVRPVALGAPGRGRFPLRSGG